MANIHRIKHAADDEGGDAAAGFQGVDGVSNGMGGVSPAYQRRTVYPPRDPKEIWVYHERQESLLCGQHCLNNLLQQNLYSVGQLADVAQSLDREERLLYLDKNTTATEQNKYLSEASGNVDESGNFSLEVLKRALIQSNQIELVSWTGETGKQLDPMAEEGFVVNRSSHWFTIRRIGGKWWNLNSTLGRPEPISEFFLAAFLADLHAGRWLIFIPRGRPLPACGQMPGSRYDPDRWYTQTELEQPPPLVGAGAGAAAAAAPAPFAGKGVKLGGTSGDADGADDSAAALAAYEREVMAVAESDPELAVVMAISRQEAMASASKPLDKDAMREKRLAALAARGL